MSNVIVTNNPSMNRYEARLDETLAGFAEYRIDGRRIIFTHTEVDDAFGGQGVGGSLARAALDDVRTTGEQKVVPRCPFIKAWIDNHPDYADLLYGTKA